MSKVTFITGNQRKADNLAKFLGIPVDHRKIELDEIQSTNLEEVVEHKVRQAYHITKIPVIVDDVSLAFTALNGLPGPFIKFFVEQPEGNEKLCRMLDSFADREAIGTSTMGYFDGSQLKLFSGHIRGVIARHPRGDGGYGWDDIFCPEGYDGKTRSELNPDEYEAVYRAIRPLDELKAFLQSTFAQ